MSESYTRVPFPPSLWKAFYRRGVASIKSKVYLDFERDCLAALKAADFKPPDAMELEVDILLFSPSWYTKKNNIRKKDVDNYLKCILDVITTYCKKMNPDFDDSMVFALYVAKQLHKDEFALISISPRDPSDYNG